MAGAGGGGNEWGCIYPTPGELQPDLQMKKEESKKLKGGIKT